MKKNKLFLFAPLAAVVGAVMGGLRSNIFYKYYDSYYGVLLKSSTGSITAVNIFMLIFAAFTVYIMNKSLKHSIMSHRLSFKNRIAVLLGCAVILVSACMALIREGGSLFNISFALLALVSCISFIISLNGRSEMSELMSCAAVLPAALALISIYKNNIKYPNISLFAFEILAALFIMLGFYFVSATYFKPVKPFMSASCSFLSLAFSTGAIVTDLSVRYTYIFEPVLPLFTTVYFIGSNLVLMGFSLAVEAEKAEKLTYMGETGIILSSDKNSMAIDFTDDFRGSVFLSEKPEDIPANAAVTEEDSRYVTKHGFAVCGFMFDIEGEPLYGQSVTTPNGRLLLNLSHFAGEGLSQKTLKRLREEYDKFDIIIMTYREDYHVLLELLEKLPCGKLILLNPDKSDVSDFIAAVKCEKTVVTPNGEYLL